MAERDRRAVPRVDYAALEAGLSPGLVKSKQDLVKSKASDTPQGGRP